jgi:hypothetical protein
MEAIMSLTRILLRLARNPGYPQGDNSQGYMITAPLDSQGHLAVEEWRRHKAACTVVRFKPGEDRDADGWLSHRGDAWYIHYDEPQEGADEAVYRLGDHRLSVGEYVTIHESDGQSLTYRVAEHIPVKPLHAHSDSIQR